jgi:hypothetical protein
MPTCARLIYAAPTCAAVLRAFNLWRAPSDANLIYANVTEGGHGLPPDIPRGWKKTLLI